MSKGTLQRLTLLGRLGADPEVKDMKGVEVAKLSVATTDIVKKKGEDTWSDETTWHRVTCFGKNAVFCRDYLKKSDSVYVEAKLRNAKWKDKDGKERFTLEIIGHSIQAVGKVEKQKDDGEEGEPDSSHDDFLAELE